MQKICFIMLLRGSLLTFYTSNPTPTQPRSDTPRWVEKVLCMSSHWTYGEINSDNITEGALVHAEEKGINMYIIQLSVSVNGGALAAER